MYNFKQILTCHRIVRRIACLFFILSAPNPPTKETARTHATHKKTPTPPAPPAAQRQRPADAGRLADAGSADLPARYRHRRRHFLFPLPGGADRAGGLVPRAARGAAVRHAVERGAGGRLHADAHAPRKPLSAAL
ncbi:hypothetical protein GEV01_17960 [Rugamonas sp. FT103W]|uniref:STM1-like N-terminal domain-containing protein n=1 Tax=Rugamonas rivuli TaxID=2743358 RepID=A0A843SG11_9BURK|nr:hypothetical protein [Rugamonas rivuli]